ncbi:MAG: hypothetical protein HFH17_04630 [Ruminococcus sp.]|nr:hypothetical protein [Ruminococcus sp.]
MSENDKQYGSQFSQALASPVTGISKGTKNWCFFLPSAKIALSQAKNILQMQKSPKTGYTINEMQRTVPTSSFLDSLQPATIILRQGR